MIALFPFYTVIVSSISIQVASVVATAHMFTIQGGPPPSCLRLKIDVPALAIDGVRKVTRPDGAPGQPKAPGYKSEVQVSFSMDTLKI